MKTLSYRAWLVAGLGLLSGSIAHAQTATGAAGGHAPASRFLTAVVLVLFNAIAVGGIVMVAGMLKRNGNWSLADALSEEAAQPAGATTPPAMVASSSRLIALLGMIVILAFFLGVSNYVLWSLFTIGVTPDLSSLLKFMFTGAALFAPYAVNQLRTAFESFTK